MAGRWVSQPTGIEEGCSPSNDRSWRHCRRERLLTVGPVLGSDNIALDVCFWVEVAHELLVGSRVIADLPPNCDTEREVEST